MPAKRNQLDYVVIADKKLDDYGPLVVELSERRARRFVFDGRGIAPRGERQRGNAVGSEREAAGYDGRGPAKAHAAAAAPLNRVSGGRCIFGRRRACRDRAAGATAYVCKPPSAAWLEVYQPQHSPVVLRQMDTQSGSAAAMHPP